MLKFKLLLLFATFLVARSYAKENTFVRSMNYLHREPPIPKQHPVSRAAVLKTMEQQVDNFNAQSIATYQMRYYENDEFFQPGAPIFIFVGGEWTITTRYVSYGLMYDIARDLNGMMYYPEHRYYGQSHPTSDASTENLRFLNVDQALADLATFIIRQKQNPGMENSPVIMVGRSYSATMVVWFRQKYPHLVAGVWASSAPLLANVDFVEYKEVTGASVRHVGGEECYSRIVRAFNQLEEIVESGDIQIINDEFSLCEPNLSDDLDIWSFFSTLSNLLAGTVQYHREGDIEYDCSIITNPNITDDVSAFAAYFRRFLGSGCFDARYQDTLDYYHEIEWNNPATSASRQWFYQTCSEYGWYQTSGSRFQPFGTSFPINLYYNLCRDVFGELFNETRVNANAERTNTIYGGMNPAVTRVIFTQGLIDPWRTMGVQTDLNDQSPAVVIPDASHCNDVDSISDDDSPEMLALKLRIISLIGQWVTQWDGST